MQSLGARQSVSWWPWRSTCRSSCAGTFDGIISWDGFFHLNQEEQRQTLCLFADHLNADGCLLLTIGHEPGEVTGIVEGEKVYHSSLAPDEYREILYRIGFNTIEIKLEDKECGFHSVLLAKR